MSESGLDQEERWLVIQVPPTPQHSSEVEEDAFEEPPEESSIELLWRACADIHDDYELCGAIGQGASGYVHKAWRRVDRRTVALKQVKAPRHREPQRVLREVIMMRAFQHPNIVNLLDIAVDQDDPGEGDLRWVYLVMPCMDCDLSELILNHKFRYNLGDVKLFMYQIFAGLSYIHRKKVIHCDIKTANILVKNQGRLFIADFGHAIVTRPLDGPYPTSVMTRWYRAPEILLGANYYTSAIDMWGAGCILGELLRRMPILMGTGARDQVVKTFKLVGSPNDENMPGYKNLPNGQIMDWGVEEGMFGYFFGGFDAATVDLLYNLLLLDGNARLTAKQAKRHFVFTSSPLPTGARLPRALEPVVYYKQTKQEPVSADQARIKTAPVLEPDTASSIPTFRFSPCCDKDCTACKKNFSREYEFEYYKSCDKVPPPSTGQTVNAAPKPMKELQFVFYEYDAKADTVVPVNDVEEEVEEEPSRPLKKFKKSKEDAGKDKTWSDVKDKNVGVAFGAHSALRRSKNIKGFGKLRDAKEESVGKASASASAFGRSKRTKESIGKARPWDGVEDKTVASASRFYPKKSARARHERSMSPSPE